MRPALRDLSIKNFALAIVSLFILGAMSHSAALAQKGESAKADTAIDATAEYERGVSALRRGDLAGARAAFEKVLRLVPNSAEGHNSLGWVLLAQGQTDEASCTSRET